MNAINVNLHNETNLNKKNKEYYSYSQINTFLNCPQKYKLIYIKNIKTEKEGIEAFIGKIVHEVLEWIYKQKSEYLISDEFVLRFLFKNLSPSELRIIISPLITATHI